ncbi:G-protein coupled receptor moody-like [Copidosoma floridanum]|uniref:G-protein coupled receptor moody-like n=1 Tax=Copidosoma floridanum TaxID=29053 RepID=UPI0006C96DB1|nr:G-protein coupled receptor moody-like [Copidosoma floridanum]
MIGLVSGYWNTSSNASEVEPAAVQAASSSCLFANYPPWLLYLAAVCCFIFTLVGIPGNIITLAALFPRAKKLRNATTVFIMNLSVSDLMSCSFNLPLATSLFLHSRWVHGPVLCSTHVLMRYGLVAVSLFSVLAITIMRLVMMEGLYKLYKRKHLALMVLSTWIGGFGPLVPVWFGRLGQFGLDPEYCSCSILADSNGRNPKVFLFVLAFAAPCTSIVVCYARIYCIVRKTTRELRDHRNIQIQAIGKSCSTRLAEDSAIGSMTHATPSENSSHHQVPELRLLPAPDPAVEWSSIVGTSPERSRCFLSLPGGGTGSMWTPDEPGSSEDGGSSRSSSPSRVRRQLPAGGAFFCTKQQTTTPRGSEAGCRKMMTDKDRKLLRMILVIFVSFVVCYLPITVTKIFKGTLDWRGFDVAGYLLIYLTTCINPVIYVVMSSEYRSAYKNVLFCRGESPAAGAQARR